MFYLFLLSKMSNKIAKCNYNYNKIKKILCYNGW